MNYLKSTKSKYLLQVLLAGIFITVAGISANAQLAAGKSKFLGNVIGTSVPSTFSTYWNQVTPENAGKWASVEATRNVMKWLQLDAAYNFANTNGYKFKQHTFVWGSQYPRWLANLSAADQKTEIEQWIQLYAQRYPGTWAVDVVNEPISQPFPYRNAIGGSGTTGWDWIIWSFEKARQYLPNAKLFLNEYGTENDAAKRAQFKTIIALLQSRGLIDGIGLQAHYFSIEQMSAAQMNAMLNDYATTGLDIYISELDIRGMGNTVNETAQKQKYEELFPVMWNHSSVKGITLWGYIEGQTWVRGSGILNRNLSERAAMIWLKGFMQTAATTVNASNPVSEISNDLSVVKQFKIFPSPSVNGNFRIELPNNVTGINIFDLNGRLVKRVASNSSKYMYIESGLKTGTYLIQAASGKEKWVQKLMIQ